MAENSLFPCSATLDYQTAYSIHKMTLPLNEWSPVSGGHPAGTNTDWTAAQVDTDTWMQGFADLAKVFLDPDSAFLSYTIYTYADADAPPRPQVTKAFTTAVGTGDPPIPASQATWNFKTTGFGTFKLVMLDTKVSAAFGPLTVLGSPADDDEIALIDYILDDNSILRGRDQNRISIWKKNTYTLNEKLRKSYRLD